MRINVKKNTDGRSQEKIDRLNEIRAAVTPEEKIKGAKSMGNIGIGLIFVFFLTFVYAAYENSKTTAVQGTVMSYYSKESTSGSGSSELTSSSYHHRFKFVDLEGIPHEVSTGDQGRDSHYDVGDVVSIGYYPDDFSEVRIHSWFGIWKIQLTLLGLGLVLIGFKFLSIKQLRAEIANRPPP